MVLIFGQDRNLRTTYSIELEDAVLVLRLFEDGICVKVESFHGNPIIAKGNLLSLLKEKD